MATIEKTRILLGPGVDAKTHKRYGPETVEWDLFNVSAPVGPGMANHFGDVMVIQAMVNVIASEASEASLCHLKPNKMPDVTGIFDKPTEDAIKSFQDALNSLLLKADGIVHPGSFAGRTIKASGPYMTISLLNDEARDASSIKYGFISHTVMIPKLFPQVIAALLL